MKIRFFILGAEQNGATQRLTTEIKCVFSDYFENDGDVMLYSGIKEATSDIAKAVENTHALVFIADSSEYGNTKSLLSKAFGFSLKCDDILLEKARATLKDDETEEENFAFTHAFIPENARKFVLDDGLFGGFSVANGNQTIILIPYDNARTSVLLYAQVIPYINSVYHISANKDKIKEYNCETLADTLKKYDTRFAVAFTNTASFFKEYIGENDELKEKISFSELAEKRGGMSPADYVVNLSIVAAEFFDCPYGVAISNAYYTDSEPDSEKVVYLAVTNDRETSIREVHSYKGEDIQNYLTRCCGDLCRFVTDVLENDRNFIDDSELRKKAAVKRYKTAIITVAALIAALGIFIAAYFTTNNYTLSQWGTDFVEWVFPAGNPFAGMFDRFVPGEDEENIEKNSVSESESQNTESEFSEKLSENESTAD